MKSLVHLLLSFTLLGAKGGSDIAPSYTSKIGPKKCPGGILFNKTQNVGLDFYSTRLKECLLRGC